MEYTGISAQGLPRDAQSILELAARSMFDLFAKASEGMLMVDREARVVWINDHHKNDPRSIWGGSGDSGYGHENGWDALKGYLIKGSVTLRTAQDFGDWFAGGKRYG